MRKRIVNRLMTLFQSVRVLFYSALSTGHLKGHVQKLQPVLVLGKGVVEFEKDVSLGYFPSPFFLNGYIHLEARHEAASIIIGEGSQINNNFTAIAEHTLIRIGKRCLIGTNVEILDSDFHGIRVLSRNSSDPKNAGPVVIGDDVFIGSNVKILKGVVIGGGSVIANGSVLVGSIPSGSIAGGNPARVIRAIEQ